MNTVPAEIIKDLELELLRPETRRSVQRLANLIADHFFECGESGNCYSKNDVLNAIPGSDSVIFTIRDFTVTTLAPETALATYRIKKEDMNTGASSWSVRSSIWQHRDGRWQIVFHQGTRIDRDQD